MTLPRTQYRRDMLPVMF